jgi:cytoskeletal protein RodZ
MASARPQSRDLGAALSGLVLGGSVIFLIVLMIVWLTNSHFAAEKAEKASHPLAAEVPVTGAIPSTTGGGTAAPVAPSPTDAPTASGTTHRTETVPSAAAPDARTPAAPNVATPAPQTKR